MYVATPFSHIRRNIMGRSRYTCTWLASRLKFMLVCVSLHHQEPTAHQLKATCIIYYTESPVFCRVILTMWVYMKKLL